MEIEHDQGSINLSLMIWVVPNMLAARLLWKLVERLFTSKSDQVNYVNKMLTAIGCRHSNFSKGSS
jgi:hypothetical protein